MKTFVFGYGSLMNEGDLQRTLPGKKIFGWAVLKGWHRKFNKPGIDHWYLNLVPAKPRSRIRQTKGVLIEVQEVELALLKKREGGYEMINITSQIISPPPDATIFAFIAPPLEGFTVRLSYLEKVLAGLPPEEREQWLAETDFDGAEVDGDA